MLPPLSTISRQVAWLIALSLSTFVPGGALATPASAPRAQSASQAPAQPPPGQPPGVSAPPQTPATGQPGTPPPASDLTGALVFGSDVGIVLNPIRADKAADFETIMGRLREALQKSTDPGRQQQGASWKVLKAAEPGPSGAVMYVFLMDPPVKGADYTVSRILAEAYPTEVEDLWTRLREAYAGARHRLSLQVIAPPAAKP